METQILAGAKTIEDSAAGEQVAVRKVEKRDGRVVDYDAANIVRAISAAYKDLDIEIGTDEEVDINAMVGTIESEIADRYKSPVRIDDIQNLVEHELVNRHLYEIARAYTSWRLNKDIARVRAIIALTDAELDRCFKETVD